MYEDEVHFNQVWLCGGVRRCEGRRACEFLRIMMRMVPAKEQHSLAAPNWAHARDKIHSGNRGQTWLNLMILSLDVA